MANIPKNQKIVTKKDIRNLHLIYNYLLYFSLILATFLLSYVGMMLLWTNFFSKGKSLLYLFKKNYTLESSIYKSINIYDLMIFNNFTIDELSESIFNDSNINKNEPNALLKSFYEDLQYAFNSKKEKNELNHIYMDFEKKTNFTCEMLYEENGFNEISFNDISEINQLNNTTKNLIRLCKKSRIDESNEILSAFEWHFQNIKNGILSMNDFSNEGLINQIKSGVLGKITVFFNCVIIFVLEITINFPHNVSKDNIKNILNRNIIITEVKYIGLDFLIILIIFIFYISNIKDYCNQIILLKKIFKIYEIQEQ